MSKRDTYAGLLSYWWWSYRVGVNFYFEKLVLPPLRLLLRKGVPFLQRPVLGNDTWIMQQRYEHVEPDVSRLGLCPNNNGLMGLLILIIGIKQSGLG